MEIGIDIEEISRFSKKKYEQNKSFYEKIFTQKEIDYCLSKSDPYTHFTSRFCAKEAVLKAIRDEKINLKDIEIIISNKKPVLNLKNKMKSLVTMSHTKNYAVAFVIIFD